MFLLSSFDNAAGDDGERARQPEDKKSPEAFLPRGTKGTKRAYELALKAFQDLAREVLRRYWYCVRAETVCSGLSRG